MWFVACKRKKNKWYSVMLISASREDLICKTQSYGNACTIANFYDEMYKNAGIKESEYRIDIV